MMAVDYNLDLDDIINEKLKKNQIKYPMIIPDFLSQYFA